MDGNESWPIPEDFLEEHRKFWQGLDNDREQWLQTHLIESGLSLEEWLRLYVLEEGDVIFDLEHSDDNTYKAHRTDQLRLKTPEELAEYDARIKATQEQ